MTGRPAFKLINLILLVLGISILILLIARIGPATIWESLKKFRVWFLVICLLNALSFLIRAWAWNIVQRGLEPGNRLLKFFRLKVIGESIESVLPALGAGGDLARAFLVRRDIPLRRGVPGILVDRTIDFIVGLLFMAVGLLVPLLARDLPNPMKLPAWVFLGAAGAGIAVFLRMQKKGLARTLGRSRWLPGFFRRRLEDQEEALGTLDQNLRKIYFSSRPVLFAAGGLHLVARALGPVEIFLVLRVLDAPVGAPEALFLGAMMTVFNTLLCFWPGGWGVSEGAHVLLVQSLGYPAGLGLSLGIIRRIRKLIFIGAALVFFIWERRTTRPSSPGP